jgi:hypothetical protein
MERFQVGFMEILLDSKKERKWILEKKIFAF